MDGVVRGLEVLDRRGRVKLLVSHMATCNAEKEHKSVVRQGRQRHLRDWATRKVRAKHVNATTEEDTYVKHRYKTMYIASRSHRNNHRILPQDSTQNYQASSRIGPAIGR